MLDDVCRLTLANLLDLVPLGATYVGHHYSWRYTFAIVTLIGVITLIFPSTVDASYTHRAGPAISNQNWGVFKRWEPWLIIVNDRIWHGWGGALDQATSPR